MAQDSKRKNTRELRLLAEKRLEEKANSYSEMSAEEMKFLIYELNVHQIELEMQHEQLYEARHMAESMLNKYTDLFNLAPIAYLVLNRDGIITEANTAACELFDVEKAKLFQTKLREFLPDSSKDIFHKYFKSIFSANKQLVCDIELFNSRNLKFYAHLISSPQGIPGIMVDNIKMAVINTTMQKKAEEIVSASLLENERQNTILLTQEQERKRIAEALHNGVGQILFAIKIKADHLFSDPQTNPAAAEFHALVKEAIDDIKNISYELVPTILEDFGLEAVIKKLCKKLEYADIEIEFGINGYEARLPLNLETSIFRIIQELVNNIIKHSEALKAGIFITIFSEILIRVEDNGVGYRPEKLSNVEDGMGLRNIKNRVRLLDGEMELKSKPGDGTTVLIKLPIKKTEVI